MIKKSLLAIVALALFAHAVHAQTGTGNEETLPMKLDGVKSVNGFLLDMKLMNLSMPKLAKMDFKMPSPQKDFNRLFQLDNAAIYTQGYSYAYSSFLYGNGIWGASSPEYLQMGSFQLKNGMRINTYGDYDKEGWRMPNRSALPWERNNFRGAFELKSEDGSFGLRIEVREKRSGLY